METWKILLITLLSAVVAGCVIGVVTGKHQVKKARGSYRPLLTAKERLVYSLCVVLGAACILIGVFVVPNLSSPSEEYPEGIVPPIADGDMIEGGEGKANVNAGGGRVVAYSRGGAATAEAVIVG